MYLNFIGKFFNGSNVIDFFKYSDEKKHPGTDAFSN